MPKLLPILHEPHPILRRRSDALVLSSWDKKELQALAADMVLTMKKAPGVGLAAPQIGKSIRLIVVERTPEPLVLINPKIVGHSLRKQTLEEGCLSVPGKYGLIKRWREVKVRAQTLDGQSFEIKAQGFLAQIFQHEIDHLHGTLYIDKATKLLQ
ncbi:peptide deformylase [Candidatus Uhrbacteria bacterium]|nr:peptide deformylase [Candidatus Uhrbacteria bacterium]